MINKLGQIMLYVNDQDQSVTFWNNLLGFEVINEVNNGQGMRWIEIAARKNSETTSIVLQNKEFVSKMSPELNLGTPSLMFFTEDIDQLYRDFVEKNITVGEIVEIPGGKVFNFSDFEGNYFAVMEKGE